MKREQGSILVAVLPLSLVAAGMLLLSMTASKAQVREHEAHRQQIRALHEANTALALAQVQIKASTYTNNNNNVLNDTLAQGTDLGVLNGQGNDIKVFSILENSETWLSELAPGWYQLDAVAAVDGKRAHVRTLIRERDPFSRFSSFVNSHPIGIGGEPKGDIHTNRVLQLFYSGGYYEDSVTARDGFEWLVGATEDNTTFAGPVNASHPEIPMPNAASIAELAPSSDGVVSALLGTSLASEWDYEVTLSGDTYSVTLKSKDDLPDRVRTDIALPTNGVLYIPGDITKLEGTLDGRLTIATPGETTITGSLRYVDSNGEPAYSNGLTTDPENNPYEPNPDYSGDAVLGVIAVGDILYSHSVPEYMEINGAFFSSTGRYGLPGLTFTSDGRYATGYDSSFRKTSLRRLGGIVTDKRIVSTVVNWSGTVLSGFDHSHSVFDPRMISVPPPHFLSIDRPHFMAYRIVSGTDAGAASAEQGGFSIKDIPIGQKERTYGIKGIQKTSGDEETEGEGENESTGEETGGSEEGSGAVG